MLLFKQIPTYEAKNCLLMDSPFLNLKKSNFYSALEQLWSLKIQSLASQNWRKKSAQMNAFRAGILEIHVFCVESTSKNKIKFADNGRRALLEQGCHLNTCSASQTILLGSLKVQIRGKYL